MKELTLDEVLRIAGGLPNLAALDELSYQLVDAPAAASAGASPPAGAGEKPHE